MGFSRFIRFSFLLTLGLAWLISFQSHSEESDRDLSSPPPPEKEGFLMYKPSAEQEQDTYQYLNKREKPNSNMDQQTKDYESGKLRAAQMVNLLQNKELTDAFQKILSNSGKTINQNKEVFFPLGVIAGAASFWYGRTVTLIKGDIHLTTRIEGASRRGEFSMNSPLFNGKLKFDGVEGMGLGIDRKISEIQAEASIQYNAKNQTFSTEVRKKIAPHLDLTFGASKMDQNTKIEYRINF